MNRSKGEERWIHCYKSTQKILLVGEGDFSFSACLARAFHTAENIVATSYLKRKSLLKKHRTSIPHLEELESIGCKVLYKVDVYKMLTHPVLKYKKFDIIIFNFPHAGHYDYLCEHDPELIKMHMNLVEAYFYSASKMLTKGGEVHLRHREDPPYASWNVVLLARNAGLTLKERVDFYKSDYPGYHNKRGGDINTNKTFPIICAATFKFVPCLPEVVDHHYYDLFKKDVHVLEMNNQVYDDEVQVLCGKDTVYYHVNLSKMKEEDHGHQRLNSDEVNTEFQKDEVNDLLEKNEANDLFVQKRDEVHLLKIGKADVDLPNNDIVVNDLDLYVAEMVDACQQCFKTDKFADDLLKKDDQVHVDLGLLKVIDHGDLLKKDKVNANLDVQKAVYDCQMSIEIQKLDKTRLKNDDNLGADHEFPKKDELYLTEMNNQVDDDKVQVLCGEDTVNDHVNVSNIKEEDHGQLHFKSDEVNSKFQKDEVNEHLEKDEANDDLFVQKCDEVHLVKKGRADVDLPNSDVNDHDLHVPEILVDFFQQCAKSDSDDLLKKADDEVHVDLELLKVINHGNLLKKDKVNADLDLQKVVDDCQLKIEILELDNTRLKNDDELGDDHDFPKKDDKVHALLIKDQDHDQQHFKNEEVHDHFLKSEEMDSDLPNNDGVNDAYLPENDDNLDVRVQEMKDDVHEHGIKNDEDDDLDVYASEMNDEMERLHGDLYARVLEMMDQLQDIKFLVNTIYA